MLVGTLLSPYIFDAISYYGCYGIAVTLSGLMVGYFMFIVKEVPRPANLCQKCNQPLNDHNENCKVYLYKNPGNNHNRSLPSKLKPSINYDTTSEYTNDEYIGKSCCNSVFNYMNNYVFRPTYTLMILPCWSMWKVLFKRRSGNLQFIVILIIAIYALFWFAVEEMVMQYNYLLEAFPGFDGDLYSIFTSVNYTCSKYIQHSDVRGDKVKLIIFMR